MNAVVKAGIGLVVVAGVGLGLGPYFIGVKGEAAYKDYLAQYEKFGFDVKIKHYNRTWFSASAEYQLLPNDQSMGMYTQWLPLFDALTIKDDIQHGPLVPYKAGFKPGFVSLSSHFVVDQEKLQSLDLDAFGIEASTMEQFKEALMQGAKGKPLLSAAGYIGFDQRFYSRVVTAALDFQKDWGTLKVEPIIIEMDTDLNLTEYKGSYAWAGLKLENSKKPLSLTMDGFQGQEQSEFLGPWMWNVDGHLQLLPMTFKPAQGQIAWSSFDINYLSQFQDQQADFEAKFEFKDLNANEFNAEQLKWTVALNHLDAAKYTEVMNVFKQINAEAMGANPEMTDAIIQRSLIEHHSLLLDLFEGIGFSITDVELISNKGDLSAKIAVNVGEVPANILQNPLLIINAFSGDATLSFDKELIPETQQEALKMPVMMGFLKDEGDRLSSALELEAGVLDVNGQQLPLGAMIAQNVQPQGPEQPQAQPQQAQPQQAQPQQAQPQQAQPQTQPSLLMDEADEETEKDQ